MKTQNKIFALAFMLLLVFSVLIQAEKNIDPVNPLIDQVLLDNSKPVVFKDLQRFGSAEELAKAFKEGVSQNRDGLSTVSFGKLALESVVATSAPSQSMESDSGSNDFSTTNIQVEGVDEADIIKTDGEYIYLIANGQLKIVKAYPDAEVVSTISLGDFHPSELFIQDDRLLVFGDSHEYYETPQSVDYHHSGHIRFSSVKLFDISDKEDPELLRSLDFEGSFLSSRLIGDNVYFVINSYPQYLTSDRVVLPKYRENSGALIAIAKPTDIGYIQKSASNFLTIASMSMSDEKADVAKETIVGSGQDVYASSDNLYIAQLKYGSGQETIVSKFYLDNGDIKYVSTGTVKGYLLNQFSMDEHKGHFRIATTISGYSNNQDTSTNNMYVLDPEMELVGELEGIAPGETIYSVRFMGNRGYMVTFRHVDPLFVIDLEDPENPEILGKLKIPGYSDYLHPLDENHLIGIGKEVDASIDADKIHTEGAVYYTAIQGVKLAIFDVSDVNNPIELHKEVIGDRGTESPATRDHKAFLFDKEKGLLVVPMTAAELKTGQPKNTQGEYTFQGAYVYDVTLEDGFDLRGRITHHDNDEVFKKSGYYLRRDKEITRSLYIKDVLYTLSNNRLQLNDLNSLERIEKIIF